MGNIILANKKQAEVASGVAIEHSIGIVLMPTTLGRWDMVFEDDHKELFTDMFSVTKKESLMDLISMNE